MTCTDAHLNDCALKGLLAQMRANADDDREALTRESWTEMLEGATANGDEFYDYDGATTWASRTSVCA